MMAAGHRTPMPLELESYEAPATEPMSDRVLALRQDERTPRETRAQRGREAMGIAVSVIACLLSSPGYFAPWLAWVALVPVLLALRQVSSLRQGAWIGGAYGLLWIAATSLPLILPLVRLAQWPAWFAFVAIPVLLLIAALPYAVAGTCTAMFRRSGGTVWILGTTIAWTVAPLAYQPMSVFASQYQSPLWLQGAAFGGIHAVQCLIVVINSILAWSVLEWQNEAKARAWWSMGAAVLVMTVAAGLGKWRLNSANTLGVESGSHTATVAWLQPGTLPGTSNNSDLSAHLGSQMKVAADWAAGNPEIDLFVLPEIGSGISYQDDEALRDGLAAIIRATGKPLVAHSSVWTQPAEYRGAPRLMNLSLFFDREGKMAANYAKRTLIPFVEYLPYETTFRWVRHVAPQAAPFAPGKLAVVFPVTSGIKAIPMLCYESLFSNQVREQVRLGGNLLVEQANDTSVGPGLGSAIHLALATMRSAELGLPMVRVTATGVSVALDARGRTIPGSRMENGERGPRLARVTVPGESSFYAKHGNVFAAFLMVTFAGCLIHALPRRFAFKLPESFYD
jgi:apolipoprotein N-acyltransferase